MVCYINVYFIFLYHMRSKLSFEGPLLAHGHHNALRGLQRHEGGGAPEVRTPDHPKQRLLTVGPHTQYLCKVSIY